MVTAVAITKHSWRWKSLFPYSLIVALGVLAVFHDHELLFWSANHRFMPMLLFLLFVFAELWFYLQKVIFTKVLLIIFALLFFIQNGLHFLDRMQALSHPDIAESFAYKKDILTDLESMLSLHAYQLNTTLLLRKNNVASSYGDAVNMQYYAMEYWAVSDFQSLTPPINFSCNQFEFLTADQIRQQAQQIILIESPLTAINSPPLLFNIYLQQAVWNIDQTTSFIVYERVACSL